MDKPIKTNTGIEQLVVISSSKDNVAVQLDNIVTNDNNEVVQITIDPVE